jgi:hypothetical protein
MKKAYDQIKREIAENKKDVIHFAVPLMWSHVEYANALIARYEAIVARDNIDLTTSIKN